MAALKDLYIPPSSSRETKKQKDINFHIIS